MRVKKLLIFFILFSTVFGRIVFELQTNLVQALPVTYQTDFNTATWVNRTNGSTTAPSDSFFLIETNNHDFILSYGSRALDGTVYVGNLGTSTASSYFRLNDQLLHEISKVALAPFDSLGTDAFEMVVAMTSTLYFVSLDTLSITWTGFGSNALSGKAIYSIDQGGTWSSFGSGVSLSRSTSPAILSESMNTSYTGIQLGFYFSTPTVTTSHYLANPQLTIEYEIMSDEAAANALKDEVILYTPCVTDEDNLVLLTEEKKQDLINKYDALSTNAKSIFNSLSIGDGFTAGQRYLFLIK
jgi:hypothetical protein